MKRHAGVIVLSGLLLVSCSDEQKPPPVQLAEEAPPVARKPPEIKEPPRSEAPPKAESTPSPERPTQTPRPEDAIRALFLAMLENDEAGIRSVILPNPKSEILWQGKQGSAFDIGISKKLFESLTCRECLIGETIELPGNKKMKVTDEMVSEDIKLLFPIVGGKPMPLPMYVIRIDGQWKVDAGALIVGRLSAKRAMEKRDAPNE